MRLPVVKPIRAFSPPSKPVIHQALIGPSFLAGTPPWGHKNSISAIRRHLSLSFSISGSSKHTIHTRIVIVDGLDWTTEVQLNILLNESRIKRTQVATFVIDTGNKTGRKIMQQKGKKNGKCVTEGKSSANLIRLPKVCNLVLRQVVITFKPIFVRVEQRKTLIR